MSLAQKILDNERNGHTAKNAKIVGIRLKELVYAYPKEVTRVLHQTGIAVSSLLPTSVLYAIVVKNLPLNSEFRETIGKMILDADSYVAANGHGWQIFGGALSALGSILSGVGRGTQTTSATDQQNAELQKQLDEQEAKRKQNNLFMWIGGAVVTIILIILIVKLVKKPKVTNEIPAT